MSALPNEHATGGYVLHDLGTEIMSAIDLRTRNSEQVTDRLSTDTCCNARNQASLWRNVTRCSYAAARGSTSPTSSSRAELPIAMCLASMPEVVPVFVEFEVAVPHLRPAWW